MKFRLVLTVLFFLPLMVKGQTPTPATPVGVKFYSKGPMYVGYGSNTDGESPLSTTLYIQGSAEFANDAGIVQKGRTALTEDFINSIDPSVATTFPYLFSKAANTAETEGVVAFIGADNKQSIKRADKYTRVGVLGGIVGAVDRPEQKAANYITFPTIRVEKVSSDPYTGASLDPRGYNYLAVDSSAAIMVDHLLVPGFNRFSVEGGYSEANPSKLNIGQALIRDVKVDREEAYSQVNLQMYAYGAGVNDNVFNANNENANGDPTLLNSLGENYMTGFTPPFVEMGADYFFYHTLTKPSESSFNSWAGNIVDPYTKLKAGVGYFMSMEVTDFDHKNDINPRWDHHMGVNGDLNRARGGFTFNRAVMADYLGLGNATDKNQDGYSRFAYPSGTMTTAAGTSAKGYRDRREMMTNEKFVISDVTVDLKKGFNFLGNPFMAPISLNYLLGVDYTDPETGTNYPNVLDTEMDTSTGKERPLFGAGVSVSTEYNDTDYNMLRAKYWLINNATVKYVSTDGYMHFKATYDYISRSSGGTGAVFKTQVNTNEPTNPDVVTSIAPEEYLIAPMQMFGLQANNEFSITLSRQLRTFGMTRFQKSASAEVDLLKDYLIVEVVSPVEKTSDRTAVAMRENASLDYARDSYDTRKGISEDMEEYKDKDSEGGKSRTYPEPSTSIIYTKSKDGESLLGNGVPLRTKEVPLYVTPPASQQTMTLNFYNLENMVSVPDVWLIDKYENKTVKLTEGYSYDFTSGPSDLNEKENRFILRFWGDDEDVIQGQTKDITVYYNTSVLHVSGLNQDDINSDMQIYDLQGRLIAKTKVNNAPSMEYLKPLSLGTYIVKITGKRNFTAKFVNLQN
ncbi:MAG: T9SS type A sorting domain-containing protein [Dysgonomonas sp.]